MILMTSDYFCLGEKEKKNDIYNTIKSAFCMMYVRTYILKVLKRRWRIYSINLNLSIHNLKQLFEL
jgi:hypothetical protein